MDWLKSEASGFGWCEGPDRNCGSAVLVVPWERLVENSVSKPCPRSFIGSAHWFSHTSSSWAPRRWLGDIFQPITTL